MLVCPNKNLREWQVLESAVGRFEAFRDFMENNGEIRDPQVVMEKIAERDNFTQSDRIAYLPNERAMSPVTGEQWVSMYNPSALDPINTDTTRANEIVNKMCTMLSRQLGVDFDVVTPAMAKELTKNAKNPWNGEQAFFIGAKVYFVGDSLTSGMVFHEFSHPLVRSISIKNPELFNSLYDQMKLTPEGQRVINETKDLYPELKEEENLFREEAIVRALTVAAKFDEMGFKPPASFAEFIKELLYNIKQLLRKIFGQKVDVSKLDQATTLNELAAMLTKGENFSIDTSQVGNDEIVAYVREQQEYINDIMKISKPELQALTVRVYDIALKHIEVVQGNKNYEEMLHILADEFNRGDLQEIKKNLGKYANKLNTRIQEVKDDLEYNKSHATAMVNTLFRLENMVNKIQKHLEEVATDPDNVDNLHKAFYYDYLMRYWKGFIDEAKQALDDEKIPANSPISQLVSKIDRNLEKSQKTTQSMYSHGVKDVLFSELMPVADNIEKKYTTIISNLRKRNASPAIIDKWHKEFYGLTQEELKRFNELETLSDRGMLTGSMKTEFEKLKQANFKGAQITKEKLDRALKGELGDANAFNSFFEGYMYNSDPVVGGFALYVKNNMNEVLAKAQGKFNDFAKDLAPLLEAAGYNPSRISELASKITEVQSVGKRDENNNLVERKILSFISPHKDYRYQVDQHRHEIDITQRAYAISGTDEDKKIMIDAISKLKKLQRDYFHQEYLPEFYQREELFERDDIGKEAAYLRENLFERMRNLTEPLVTQMDELQIADQLDDLWREYRQLNSRFDMNGKIKTGKDLEIAERLRDYREASRKFYEWKERQGVFQNALLSYEQELVDAGYPKGSDDFRILRDEWLKKNTKTVIKPEFYVRRQAILDRISTIMKNLPDAERKKIDTSESWGNIIDIVSSFRDDDGQPKGSDMNANSIAEVKELQERIIAANKAFSGLNGLTPAESQELGMLFVIVKAKERPLTPEERERMTDLMGKRDINGLNEFQKTELFTLFSELENLQHRESTEYYTDVVNNWLTKLNTDHMFATIGSRMINKVTADMLLEDGVVNSLTSQDPEFAKWFQDNHIRKEKWDDSIKEKIEVWERLYVWSVVRPNEDKYLESTVLKDAQGQPAETIYSLPSTKYFARVVKKQYRTERIVTKTVDNKGQWLPRTDVKDSPFNNEAYEQLRLNDPKHFEILQKMTEHHLKNQEGLSYKSRLYLDVPRFRKNSLEVLQTQQIKRTIKGAVEGKLPMITILAKRIRNFWVKAKDDAESGFSYNDDFNLVRADMFDNEISNVPIAGLYDIDIDDTSTDLTHGLMRYMLSAERQKKLVEINPVAQALRSVVNDEKNQVKRLDAVNKFNFLNRGVTTYLNQKGKGVRKSAVNNLIEREFEGKANTGMLADVPWINNTATLLFKRASFGFFALNIPSAIKNSLGAKFQGQLEAAAGTYLNTATFAQGEAWAFNTMGQISFEIYKKGPKSLNIQVTELFDAIQGRFEEKFGESMSRTLASDTVSLSWLYNFRKWTESQATLQIFAGMMYHQKIEQNGKEISYMDAWEVRDGKIQLKAGIDPEWGVTYDQDGKMLVGSKFKMMKNRFQQVSNNLQGAYGHFDQPEAQRYLAFRFVSFLRRFFTTMAVNRWGFQGGIGNARGRLNPGLGDVHEGYYITVLKTLSRMVTTDKSYLGSMTPQEKAAWIKTVGELAALMAISMLILPGLGWDPDDPDKYEKLRQNSGAMPFLGMTAEDSDHPFDLGGFLHNHLINLAMQTRAENEQFVPWPGYGLNDYASLLDLKSLAAGPTINAYQQMFTVGLDQMTGDPSAYYLRNVGPYHWQQEGGAKFWNHTMKALGITGSSIDPTTAIKNFQGIQARGK